MKAGTRPYNEAAILRTLLTEKWKLWSTRGAFYRIITVLYNEERQIGVEIGGIRHGRVWSHYCPLKWRSKRLGNEASDWTDRHTGLDAVGKPEV